MVLLEAASGSLVTTLASALQLTCSLVAGAFAAQDVYLEQERLRKQSMVDFIFVGSYPEEPVELQNRLGGGLFGQVFRSRRYGREVAVKLPRQGGPVPPEPILKMEFQRSCRLSHANVVKAFERIGPMTFWHLAQGSPWEIVVPQLAESLRIQVAVQLCSAMSYLVEVAHIVWDLHSEDVLLDCRQHHPHLTILDIFMEPSETSGCLWSLLPLLRCPPRLQKLRDLGNLAALRVNGFAGCVFLGHLTMPHQDIKTMFCKTWQPSLQLFFTGECTTLKQLETATEEVVQELRARPPPPGVPPPPPPCAPPPPPM